MPKTLFILLQYLIPQHLLSRFAGKVADCTTAWIKNPLIEWFIKKYNVDMSLALEEEPRNYANFNAFFTRALKAGVRPIDEEVNTIVSPADGAISQLGGIDGDRVFQAKGQSYDLHKLLGGDKQHAELFANGKFATVYLSPRDYHRVHMPIDGELTAMTYVPGDLFSVNQVTAENVSELFARNERLIAYFDTPAGPMAMILVGAMIVAGIETVWAGQVAPPPRMITRTDYRIAKEHPRFKKGDEMGRFKLGSTVILLFTKDAMQWAETLEANSAVKMGEAMGNVTESIKIK
jgi:phosphatidylserine decarboxylase